MLITNFRLKYLLYKIVCGAYQLVDTGRIHPVRERALRGSRYRKQSCQSKFHSHLRFLQKNSLTAAPSYLSAASFEAAEKLPGRRK